MCTGPCTVHGDITKAGIRCASTWSAPSCVSSSTTKIADCFQIEEWLTMSTSWPSARSLSATIARGVYAPGVVPFVWSFGRIR